MSLAAEIRKRGEVARLSALQNLGGLEHRNGAAAPYGYGRMSDEPVSLLVPGAVWGLRLP